MFYIILVLMTHPVKKQSIFGRLNLREKILLCLMVTGSVVEEAIDSAYDPFNLSYCRGGYSFEEAEFLRAKEKTIRQTLYYLKINKLITAAKSRQGAVYHLTADGLELIFSRFPKLRYRGKAWDGYWRVVAYDIPDKSTKFRDRLRAQLKHLGFKFIQNSVWVTPLPVEAELAAFLKREGLWGRILVLKSVLPNEESRRWADIFRVKVLPCALWKNNVAALVERCFASSQLPHGLA